MKCVFDVIIGPRLQLPAARTTEKCAMSNSQ